MKAVEMMKKAINDSDLKGWKWSASKNGFKWEYCNIEFRFEREPNKNKSDAVRFIDTNEYGEKVSVFIVSEEDAWLCDEYHDFETDVDKAIYWAARKMISTANELY